METCQHNLATLFAQLGLANSQNEIDTFIHNHKIAPGLTLVQAPFWNSAQASFLRESLEQDADWSEVIDMLDTLLR